MKTLTRQLFAALRTFLTFRRKVLIFVVLLFLYVFVFSVIRIQNALENAVHSKNTETVNQDLLFEKTSPTYLNFQDVAFENESARAIEKYQDSYFAATKFGLLELTKEGKLVRHFTVADGLPEDDLRDLAVIENKLFISTNSNEIIAFDGERFGKEKITNAQCLQEIACSYFKKNKILRFYILRKRTSKNPPV